MTIIKRELVGNDKKKLWRLEERAK